MGRVYQMERNDSWPRLLIDLNKLEQNAREVTRLCGSRGISVAGVIKGANGLIPCVKAIANAGVRFLASSRLEQLQRVREAGIDQELLMLRVSMLSEVEKVVRLCDISLQSDPEVLDALDHAAAEAGVTHRVILMADLGDLREGWWDKDAFVQEALRVEQKLPHLELAGIGTNLGCYGSIVATKEKMEELVALAEAVESAIGRELEWISGGATTSLPRVLLGDMPPRVNLLRVGEGILLAEYMLEMEGYDAALEAAGYHLNRDVFTLQAELLEVRDKPTYPVGVIGAVDAFGHTVQYEDRGIRRRGLLGLGKVDYGDPGDLIPRTQGVEVLGASSDHTILDLQAAQDEGQSLKTGDIIDFDLTYSTLVYATNSENVQIEYIGE